MPESFVSFGDTQDSKDELTPTRSVSNFQKIEKVDHPSQDLTVSFFMSVEEKNNESPSDSEGTIDIQFEDSILQPNATNKY